MKYIPLIIVGILLIFNTGVSLSSLKNSERITSLEKTILTNIDSSQQVISSNTPQGAQIQEIPQIPPEVQESRDKTKKLQAEKPYLFMSPEDLSRYNCSTIQDMTERKLCKDIGDNYKLSQILKDLKSEQIVSFDCTTIIDKTLIDKCTEYKKMMEGPNM